MEATRPRISFYMVEADGTPTARIGEQYNAEIYGET